jgi:hypothetical protein
MLELQRNSLLNKTLKNCNSDLKIIFKSDSWYKFPCIPNTMKLCGNTSYGSRMFQKNLEIFHQVLTEQERFL